jgi:hypothetical protein
MGYLINPNPLANYKKFIIPQADIIAGSTFLTTDLGANKFWFLTFATFRLINSTVNYQGFTHIVLQQTGGNRQGFIETIQMNTPGEIEPNFFYTFAYNVQHTPNRFGAYTSGPRYQIGFDGTYTAGNGDIELHFYYNEITI